MGMSKYTDSVILTRKHSGQRTHSVKAFVIHHMAAKWTGEQCAKYFRDTLGLDASANYCIGYRGDVCLNVEEKNRAWTSSSYWADQRAITFELANSSVGHPWQVSDVTIEKLILILAELHQKYGLKTCTYTGDTRGTLWRHDFFASTNCPGPYLGEKLPWIAKEVNRRMKGGKAQAIAKSSPKRQTQRKTDQELADEVIAGHYGNGAERRRKLGNRYSNVQALVNRKLGSSKSKAHRQSKSLHLPKTAKSWAIYRPNGPYTLGHQIGYLAPAKFDGLIYEIKGSPMKDVQLIDTRDFGRVAIYTGAGTGAVIK